MKQRSKIIPVILSGGSGTRLWPLSRSMRPKQFIQLLGEQSLFQMTLSRLSNNPDFDPPVIVCNEDHRFLVAEQCQEVHVTANSIILEPCGKNTAPAIAAAAHKLLLSSDDKDTLILVLPADHLIHDHAAFHATVNDAVQSASQGNLVTFGIVPDHASTGYGYLQVDTSTEHAVYPVSRFIEKPDAETAQSYLDQGGYFWNSGMFLFKPGAYLDELKAFEPAMVDAVEKSVSGAQSDLDFFRLEPESYDQFDGNSIDYAVMERSSNTRMLPLQSDWSDIGSWSSVWKANDKDDSGNAISGDVLLDNVSNCYLHAENKLIAATGISDLIVVETHDGVMVSKMQSDQDVKNIVNKLNTAERPETQIHRKAFRPWGNYDCLDQGDRFQVKRILVKPGQATSIQKHFHRAEHWIVVSGTAEITCGEETFILTENQSTFIPLGTLHRLKNPGTVPLEIIEVQSGTYLGEDDIERIDDLYGRD